LRSLGLTGTGLQASALVRWLSPDLAPRLTALAVYGPCPDAGWVQALAATPNVSRLRALSLTCCQLGDDGVRALASSPHLADLTHLNLEGEAVSAAGAAALADSPHLCEAIRNQWRGGSGGGRPTR
jgi:hypothetical protein